MVKRKSFTEEDFIAFQTRMYRKFIDGRKEHGKTFNMNPVEEAQKECLDISNYALVLFYRLEDLKSKVEPLGVIKGESNV